MFSFETESWQNWIRVAWIYTHTIFFPCTQYTKIMPAPPFVPKLVVLKRCWRSLITIIPQQIFKAFYTRLSPCKPQTWETSVSFLYKQRLLDPMFLFLFLFHSSLFCWRCNPTSTHPLFGVYLNCSIVFCYTLHYFHNQIIKFLKIHSPPSIAVNAKFKYQKMRQSRHLKFPFCLLLMLIMKW